MGFLADTSRHYGFVVVHTGDRRPIEAKSAAIPIVVSYVDSLLAES
mgnify:CR=1 FL=1